MVKGLSNLKLTAILINEFIQKIWIQFGFIERLIGVNRVRETRSNYFVVSTGILYTLQYVSINSERKSILFSYTFEF
jgi:hypothetical protein